MTEREPFVLGETETDILCSKFKGDLKKAIAKTASKSAFKYLESMGMTDPDNLDALLAFLYGEQNLDGVILDIKDINKLISAIEKHLSEIIFKNRDHLKRFNSLCDRMENADPYHESIAYLLTLDAVCSQHIDDLFDFENDGIKPEGINKAWQTDTSKKTTRLAFNLWNCCTRDDDENGSHGMPASPLYTPAELFCTSYAKYYFEAIELRYPDYFIE